MNDDDPHDGAGHWTARPRDKECPPGSFAFPALLVLVALLTLIVAVGVIYSALTGRL